MHSLFCEALPNIFNFSTELFVFFLLDSRNYLKKLAFWLWQEFQKLFFQICLWNLLIDFFYYENFWHVVELIQHFSNACAFRVTFVDLFCLNESSALFFFFIFIFLLFICRHFQYVMGVYTFLLIHFINISLIRHLF